MKDWRRGNDVDYCGCSGHSHAEIAKEIERLDREERRSIRYGDSAMGVTVAHLRTEIIKRSKQ